MSDNNRIDEPWFVPVTLELPPEVIAWLDKLVESNQLLVKWGCPKEAPNRSTVVWTTLFDVMADRNHPWFKAVADGYLEDILPKHFLVHIDSLVRAGKYPNRIEALEALIDLGIGEGDT